MKRFTLYIIILYNVFFLVGCNDTLEYPVDPTPLPRAKVERTVIVYMVADNSLSDVETDKKDIAEMVAGKDLIPEDVNFIIFQDTRSHKPVIYELSAKNGIQLWKQYSEELCSTDSEVMLKVLRKIEKYFPARHYGITFWSHATGWAPKHDARRNTFGQDCDDGTTTFEETEMEIPVLRDVLAQLPKFDYIFFDACFMQGIEVAYELRNVTDFMVGSPAEIPGPGAPYNKIIKALCEGDAMGIVQGYDSGYPSGIYSGVLLSCIDCTKLDALAEATGQLLTPFYMGHSEPNAQQFQYYCNRYINKFTYCFDMRTTMRRLLSDEDYATWMTAFEEAVPLHSLSYTNSWFANYCSFPIVLDPDCYGGVSMFVPMTKYDNEGCTWNTDFQKTSWYEATGWDATGW